MTAAPAPKQENKAPVSQPTPQITINKPKKERKEPNINAELIKDTLVNFIVPLIALGISIGLGVLVLYPAYKSYPEIQSQLETNRGTKDVLEKKLADLNTLVDFKSIVDENSSLVNRVLVSDSHVPELLNQIDNIARGSGLAVEKLSYSHGNATSDATSVTGTVDVSLSVAGTFDQMVLFFQKVEEAARIINVTTFRYSDTESVLASFSIEAPYMSVESSAVTDEPLQLNIADPAFVDFINMLKGLTFYEFDITATPPVVEEALETGPVEEETPEEPQESEPEATPEEIVESVVGEDVAPATE